MKRYLNLLEDDDAFWDGPLLFCGYGLLSAKSFFDFFFGRFIGVSTEDKIDLWDG